jgi:hypothetical protein
LHGLIYSILWGGPGGKGEDEGEYIYVTYYLMEMNGNLGMGNGDGDIPNCYHLSYHSLTHSNSVFVVQTYVF